MLLDFVSRAILIATIAGVVIRMYHIIADPSTISMGTYLVSMAGIIWAIWYQVGACMQNIRNTN